MSIIIKDLHEFNNCGSFVIVTGGQEYFTKWKINNGSYEYDTKATKEVLEEVKKQFELPNEALTDDSKFIKGRDYKTYAVTNGSKVHTLQVIKRLVQEGTGDKWMDYTIDNRTQYRSKIFTKEGKEYIYPERFAMGFVSDDYLK